MLAQHSSTIEGYIAKEGDGGACKPNCEGKTLDGYDEQAHLLLRQFEGYSKKNGWLKGTSYFPRI